MEAGLKLGKFRPFVGLERVQPEFAPLGATVSVDHEDEQLRFQLRIFLVSVFLAFGIGILQAKR